MSKENISPEERLLRLIRGKKTDPAPKQDAAVPSSQAKARTGNPIADLFSKYKNLANIKIILWGSMAIAVIYLGFTIISPLFGSRNVLDGKTQAAVNNPAVKQDIKPLDYYMQGVKDRSIFEGASSSAQPAGIADAELIKDINLVGIIAGEEPQAVIEDKKAQKTYYLTKGQSLGEFVLSEIKEGKIVLNYHGQNYELHL